MSRETDLQSFLNKNGWGNAKRISLAADASLRTYERLEQGTATAILMNSPLSERPEQFVLIDNILRNADVHAPKILAQDLTNGFLILEDFGNDTFTKLLNKGFSELDLYRKGIDALIKIQDKVVLPDSGIPIYSFERLMNEVMLLPNWFGKALPGGLSEVAITEFKEIWVPLIQKLEKIPNTLVLLDYHADNLMITTNGDCGILDFQDARIGPVGYDLMSLLEDERRDVSPSVRKELIEYYFKCRPQVDTPLVRETLPIITMQRHTKVIGIFVRLFLRDKKEKYLRMIPLVWELTERHLDEPIFHEYKHWIEKYIPKNVRHTPLNAEDLT